MRNIVFVHEIVEKVLLFITKEKYVKYIDYHVTGDSCTNIYYYFICHFKFITTVNLTLKKKYITYIYV